MVPQMCNALLVVGQCGALVGVVTCFIYASQVLTASNSDDAHSENHFCQSYDDKESYDNVEQTGEQEHRTVRVLQVSG